MSKVRGSGRGCQAATVQEQPRGATLHPRPGVTARRSNPTSEVRDCSREEQPHVQGAVAVQAQEEGQEELLHVQGLEGRCKEIPLIQGKEQWLRFAGTAMKRYPMPKVRETQARW